MTAAAASVQLHFENQHQELSFQQEKEEEEEQEEQQEKEEEEEQEEDNQQQAATEHSDHSRSFYQLHIT